MANILVCADGFFRGFSPLSLEPYIQGFIDILIENGHNVMPYIDKDITSGNHLRNSIYHFMGYCDVVAFKPDFIFAFNNVIDERFLHKYNCPIYIIASDTPLYWHNKDLILKYPGRFYVLYFNNDFENELIENFKIDKKHQLLIPYTTAIVPESIEQDKDISFVGNFCCATSLGLQNKIIKNLPNVVRDNAAYIYKQMFDEYKKTGIISQRLYNELQSLIHNPGITVDDIATSFCSAITNKGRIDLLSGLLDLDLHIYTFMDNLTCIDFDYNLWKKCHFQFITTIQDNQRIYNTSKISLNLPHAQVHTGFSWRTCDIMASNAMLLSNPTDDLIRLFSGIVPTYTDAKDLHDKCEYFIKHESERCDIVKKCNEIINKNHRYENLMILLNQFMGLPLKTKSTPGHIVNIHRTQYKQNKYNKKIKGQVND